jgi:putative transposase
MAVVARTGAAYCETRNKWRGVEFIVSDDPRLKAAIPQLPTGEVWHRCCVHLLGNALHYVPRKVEDDRLMELRWFYHHVIWSRSDAISRPGLASGRKIRQAVRLDKDNLEKTLTLLLAAVAHHKHIKSTNMLRQLNQEIKRRTSAADRPQRGELPATSLCAGVDVHENWLEATRNEATRSGST